MNVRLQYVLLDGKKIPRLNPSNPRLKVFIEVWKQLPVGIATWLDPWIVGREQAVRESSIDP